MGARPISGSVHDSSKTERSAGAHRIAQFLVAGSVGLGVDAGVLLALAQLAGWQPMRARAASFVSAVSVTWLINRYSTFSDRRAMRAGAFASEYVRYFLTQSMGAIINLAVFWLALRTLPALHRYLLVPLIAGSACALLFNYCVMQYLVFPRRTPML